MKSKKDRAIIKADKNGYYVVDGNVYHNGKKLKLIQKDKNKKYYFFGIKMEDGMVCHVSIHRFIAYKKFGNKIFNKKFQVRHLDSNSFNNSYENIGIGTCKDNSDDKSPEVKKKSALIATNSCKKHNHEEIIKLYEEGFSYKEIMKRFGIKSKGTISFIINNSMASKNDII